MSPFVFFSEQGVIEVVAILVRSLLSLLSG